MSQERRNYTNRVSFCTIMAASVGENKGHKRANFRPKNDTGTKFLMPSCLYIVNLCFKYKKIYMKNFSLVLLSV